jgi:hypothetical protein
MEFDSPNARGAPSFLRCETGLQFVWLFSLFVVFESILVWFQLELNLELKKSWINRFGELVETFSFVNIDAHRALRDAKALERKDFA